MKTVAKIFSLICFIAVIGCDKKSLTVDFPLSKPKPATLNFDDYSGVYGVAVTKRDVTNLYQGQGNYIGSTVTTTSGLDTLLVVDSLCVTYNNLVKYIRFEYKSYPGVYIRKRFYNGKYQEYGYNSSYNMGYISRDSVWLEIYNDSHTSNVKYTYIGKKIN